MSRTIDALIVYRILRLFATKIEDTDAYKLGIIDADGKKLKNPNSEEERNAWTLLTRFTIKVKQALDLVDDFAEVGIKGVSLISDGESTLSKAYVPFIQHASKSGIDVGNATNGWEWEPDKIDQVLQYLTWVRFTVAAGTPEGYARIMFKNEKHTDVFDRAMKHIRYAVELKKKQNLKVTLGIQMVLMPEFKDEIIPFAKLAVDLGVDYGVIKHCSDDEMGTLGVDYSKYEEMYDDLHKAESLGNENTKIMGDL